MNFIPSLAIWSRRGVLISFCPKHPRSPVAEIIGHDEDQVGFGLSEGSDDESERKDEFRRASYFSPLSSLIVVSTRRPTYPWKRLSTSVGVRGMDCIRERRDRALSSRWSTAFIASSWRGSTRS